jgi:hypothetical protein
MQRNYSNDSRKYGMHKEIDKSIFKIASESPRRPADLCRDYFRATEVAVSEVLRKQGVDVVYAVRSCGQRVVIELVDVSEGLENQLSSLIARALVEVKARLFGAKRFEYHHSVVVNGRLLSFSY